jgi:hypothetical protein
MPEAFLKEWQDAFFQGLQSHEAAQSLREAAVAGRLGDWTTCLTRAVVHSCKELGWVAAARGHLADVLPIPRNEYLALDVMAFQQTAGNRWPLPVAVFELENSPDNDRVAYALWKLLCIRASLRVLFAYRWESAEGSVLAGYLAENVVGSLSISERMYIGGDTLVLIGSRAEGETFPYGYFKEWILDTNTGRFIRA